MSRAIEKAEAWHRSLAGLAEDGGAVELVCLSNEGLPVGARYRVRVLACEEDGIVVAKPRYQRGETGLRGGQELAIVGGEAAGRWEGVTKVAGVGRYQLNRRRRVSAIRLALPTQVVSAQRRCFYRVAICETALQAAYLSALDPQAEGRLHTKLSFPARVVNISGGGMSLDVPARAAELLGGFDRLLCELRLPTESDPVLLTCRVVRLRVRKDGSHDLGLKYEFEDEQLQRRQSDLICRFAAWAQRRQLQVRGVNEAV